MQSATANRVNERPHEHSFMDLYNCEILGGCGQAKRVGIQLHRVVVVQ